ncbi:hypothetical protein [Pelagicoccus sp. SDUM812005]|uniref:hypothetical protein n=1 Tax=Pelagicoccus sp. SDUM812005 TaxID=3041257 RepID=UPI0028104D2D|nr:hypothetical protein [Pelagicoccus sp. SDUM812005]MDQ8182148.1 hypothetical protein [Pelagicoccus sp. SDUM812005]
MKQPSFSPLSTLVACSCSLLAIPVLQAAKLDGEQILRKTLSLYASAGYYSCQASIEEEITLHHDYSELEQGMSSTTVPLAHPCSLTYRRPDQFDAQWSIVDTSAQVQRSGSLSTAEDIYILAHQYPTRPELTEEPDQYQSLDQAIDYSEFASLRFTSTLRDFLDPAFHDDLLANEIRLSGTRKLGKLRCYVLRLEGYKSMTLWIDRNNFALCKIDYAADFGTLQSEAAWLDWKLNQAQLALDPDSERIHRRLNLYRDPPNIRSNSYSILFRSQNIQP